ncbi:MAG: hypothetical protein HDT35_08260 [Clostridiales bacterium]|nr:hypothetical protein [Clostridiales bacterium]
MKQIETNKRELLEMMEELGGAPLSNDSICDLSMLMGAYKALCVVTRKELEEDSEEAAQAHTSVHSMDKQDAESWVDHMKNADGSIGAHWPMDKTEQVRAQRGLNCDPVKFWAAMNMMYSDYCEAAKKNNASTVDFFADMAKAFLDDADARPDKLARYHKYVAMG